MKKRIILISVFVVMFATSILVSNGALKKEKEVEFNFKEISYLDYAKLIKSEGINIIFVGSSNCGFCDLIKPNLKQVAKGFNLAISYLDLAILDEEEYSLFIKSDDFFSEVKWGTPLILFFVDGVLRDEHIGYAESEALKQFFENNL